MKINLIFRWIGLCILFNSLAELRAGSVFDAGTNQFADAAVIGPTGGISAQTDLSGYSTEGAEPAHRPGPDLAADKTAWWQWTAPADGFFVADTLLGISQLDFFTDRVVDTLIAVYEGASLNNLDQIAYNDDFASSAQPYQPLGLSRVAFRARQGVTYHIVVDGARADSIDATKKFVMLEARFIRTQKQSFLGLARSEDNIFTMGGMRYNQTAQMAYTASVQLGGKTTRFRGVLDTFGYTSLVLPNSIVPELPSTLILDPSEDEPNATLLANGAYPVPLDFHRVEVFAKNNPTPRAGYYTGSIKLASDLHTFGSVRIAGNGRARAIWRTPDNQVATMASQLVEGTPQGLPFYRALSRGRAVLALGMNQFVLNGVKTGSFAGAYFRTAGISDPYFTNGLQVNLNGGHIATYAKPATGNRVLGFLDGSNGDGSLVLINKNGELSGDFVVVPGLNLGTNNRFTFPPSDNKPRLVLNRNTGMVTGQVTDFEDNRRRIFGVAYQDRVVNDLVPRIRGLATGKTFTLPFSVDPL